MFNTSTERGAFLSLLCSGAMGGRTGARTGRGSEDLAECSVFNRSMGLCVKGGKSSSGKRNV